MKKGDISTDQFSYKEDFTLRLSNNNYILAVKDEDFPDKNIIPIVYFDNGNVRDIDEYDMERIVVIPHKTINDKSLSRFDLNQLIKVSFGKIDDNSRYYEGSKLPKCSTIDSYIYPTDKNDLVEIFKGIIDESTSRIKLTEPFLDSLILNIYIEYNTPIFIETNEKIIGPFRAISKDSEGYFIVEKNLWKPFGEYKLNENAFIEFTANEIPRKIHIPSFNKFELIRTLDFKDNIEIINEFKTKLKETPELFDKDYINNLLDIINKTHKIKSIEKYLEENKRISEILKNTQESLISNIELAALIPELSTLKQEIEKLQNDESELKRSLEIISSKEEILRQEMIYKQESLDLLKIEFENLSKTKEEELLKIKLDLENEILELKKEKENIELEIRNETEIKSHELNSLKSIIENLEKEKEDLDFTVTELRQENRKVQRDAQEELINVFRHKKYFDFLSGRDLSEFDSKDTIIYKDFSIQDSYTNYLDFRKDLISILNQNGRNFESHFIDNLLISIHQNTLTILAGLPGTGKTSLARLLTKILAPKDRVIEVSVGRGWSSLKDLIGFQNPLTNKFHSAPTGVYELLTQLDYECQNGSYLQSPLSYIILDEANLSPIEHYWSTFYNLTDTSASKDNFLTIPLGNKTNLEFANNLRFIATINYDQTTESLSPRVLDRANIIQIPSINSSIDAVISLEDVERLNISFNKSIEFFKLMDFQIEKQNIELSEELDLIFNEIKRKFKSLRIPISHRVEKSIKMYCYVAKDWMKKEISRPLDYSIAQRVLPMINLQGESAKINLEELLGIFEKSNLKKSYEILKDIIDTGNEDSIYEGNYNYFLTLSNA
jgi:energy-coupling factor transporter ATP-binding protein EcfA2